MELPTTHRSTTDSFAHFDLPSMPPGDVYKLLASVVVPRPIAWITSRSAGGAVNAAPFSFFNLLSAEPPLVAVAFSAAPDRDHKDTLVHIRETRAFVVNMVSEELAEAMNDTAIAAPRGTDETQLAGLELTPGTMVQVPRISASPVSLECQFFQEVATGSAAAIVLGRVVYAHVRAAAFTHPERLSIDSARLRLIGRMEVPASYCTTRDTFHLERKSWPPSSGEGSRKG